MSEAAPPSTGQRAVAGLALNVGGFQEWIHRANVLRVAGLGEVLVMLAVDRVLDMVRSSVNVWSDSVGAAVVSRWEPVTSEGSAVGDPA